MIGYQALFKKATWVGWLENWFLKDDPGTWTLSYDSVGWTSATDLDISEGKNSFCVTLKTRNSTREKRVFLKFPIFP